MARRTEFVSIPTDDADNRDGGKLFKLTELPADQGEEWAVRAFLALARGGVDVPEDIARAGLEGIARMGFGAFAQMRPDDAIALMGEMMRCIEVVPDPANRNVTTPLFPASIEEISTRFLLRKRIFGLHVDFSKLVARYNSALAASQQATDSPTT